MQAWICDEEPTRIGADLHGRFARSYAEGSVITPEQSARPLLPHLSSGETGQIWDASVRPHRSVPLMGGINLQLLGNSASMTRLQATGEGGGSTSSRAA